MNRPYCICLLFLLFTAKHEAQSALKQTKISFELIKTGDLVNTPADSRSVNFVDVNQDGWEDIFISNGPKGGQNNQLFINRGDGTFRVVDNDPLVLDNSPSDGASFADMDNDGDLDAFVVTWYGEPNLFYQNQGDGSFRLVKQAGIDTTNTFSETASWGDPDGDGWLDLYVTNSTDFATNSPEVQRNLFYKNQGGRLHPDENWRQSAQISRSANWADYDDDGDADLFIANEENQVNQLYQNEGMGEMRLQATALGLDTLSSTSGSWADVDNDGDLDLFVANWLRQTNQLFYNEGEGRFRKLNLSPEGADGGCSFGSAFGDADNDGDLDLFITNAFCRGELQNFFYRNDGRGNFSRDTISFPSLKTVSSYGVAWGDIDNDGHLDLMVANCTPHPSIPHPANTLFRNLGNENRWLEIKLKGSLSNRSAIGARIRLKATIEGKEVWQTRSLSAQSGYCGQNSLTAHFGLGAATIAEQLIVDWPSGRRSVRQNIKPNQILEIVEEAGDSPDVWREYVQNHARPFGIRDTANFQDLHFLREQLKDKRIVLLGEFTHGAKEINEAKIRLIRFLHEEMGYNLLLFESGLGEIYSMNYRRRELSPDKMLYTGLMGPWHTREYLPLTDYLKRNEKLKTGGFDPQRSGRSFALVLDQLSASLDPSQKEYGSEIEQKFTDLSRRLRRENINQALLLQRDSLITDYQALSRKIENQSGLLQQKGYQSRQLRLIRQAINNRIGYLHYYANYRKDYRLRFAARDSLMAENVLLFAQELYPNEKIIISGHNYHISKFNEKEKVLGERLYQVFGDQLYAVGVFAAGGTHADNGRQPKQIDPPTSRQDLKQLIHMSDIKEAAWIDMSGAKKKMENAWMFNRIKVDGFVNLNSDSDLIPKRWFDGLIFLREISPPSFTY